MNADDFIARWSGVEEAERANFHLFINDLCQLLKVPAPNPTKGSAIEDDYVFEKKISVGRSTQPLRIDLYKMDCFVMEAKSKKNASSAKQLEKAKNQALNYANKIHEAHPQRHPRVPFVIVCDIGNFFELYASFDDEQPYRPFPNHKENRIYIREIEQFVEFLRKIWLDPWSHETTPHNSPSEVNSSPIEMEREPLPSKILPEEKAPLQPIQQSAPILPSDLTNKPENIYSQPRQRANIRLQPDPILYETRDDPHKKKISYEVPLHILVNMYTQNRKLAEMVNQKANTTPSPTNRRETKILAVLTILLSVIVLIFVVREIWRIV